MGAAFPNSNICAMMAALISGLGL